ncbi:MAG: RHS repeat-associated core domain-containing protein [Chloroflexi bacterium]|nr:RHS repeat-associated core domain-containing protein [Chloroflexota bacterium]
MRKVVPGSPDTVHYLANDHLGGTAVVMHSDGSLASRMRYYPYGMVWTTELGTGVTAIPTDKLFTGQQREGPTSGIYYYGARFYSADLGRFLQADSVVPGAGNPQALNRYTYVLNNPLLYNDPTGYFPCPGCDFVKKAAEIISGTTSTIVAVAKSGWELEWWAYQGTTGFLDPWAMRALSMAKQTSAAVVSVGQGLVSSPAAEFVADYVSDKAQDVAWFAAITAVNPGTFPQNAMALSISLGSVGDRRAGSYGFALYENCKGLCQIMDPFLKAGEAYTPGFLGFAPTRIRDSTFRHENRHAIQSLTLGLAYWLSRSALTRSWVTGIAPSKRTRAGPAGKDCISRGSCCHEARRTSNDCSVACDCRVGIAQCGMRRATLVHVCKRDRSSGGGPIHHSDRGRSAALG